MIIKMKYLGLITGNLPTSIEVSDGTDLAGLIQAMRDEYGVERIDTIVKKSTFLVNNKKTDENSQLNDGDKVMVLTVLGGG